MSAPPPSILADSPSSCPEWLDRQNKWAITLVAIAANGALYLIPNHFQFFAVRELPLTEVDRWVPFLPLTAWIYWSDYFLVMVSFQLCRARGTQAYFVAAFVALATTGVFIHLIFPTAYPRDLFPVGPEVDPLTRGMLELFRVIDTPASCLPSLHVGACYLSAFAAWSQAGRYRFGRRGPRE